MSRALRPHAEAAGRCACVLRSHTICALSQCAGLWRAGCERRRREVDRAERALESAGRQWLCETPNREAGSADAADKRWGRNRKTRARTGRQAAGSGRGSLRESRGARGPEWAGLVGTRPAAGAPAIARFSGAVALGSGLGVRPVSGGVNPGLRPRWVRAEPLSSGGVGRAGSCPLATSGPVIASWSCSELRRGSPAAPSPCMPTWKHFWGYLKCCLHRLHAFWLPLFRPVSRQVYRLPSSSFNKGGGRFFLTT